ncbi:MAG: DNA-binding protein [Deltaproteobacteria bacterium]|nr:MAG: DNA-binding protein [Deltaproteobacteria bacterium]
MNGLKVGVTKTLAGILSVAIIFISVHSWAQQGMGPGGGPRRHYGMMWDAGAVTTMSGEVVAVDKYTPGRGGSSYGLHLTLKTDKETLPVILGPAWYVEQQHFTVAAKDQVKIKGSRVSVQGQSMLIAQEVKKGDKILKMRNDKGFPLWAGPR